MNSGMITENQNIMKMQGFVIWTKRISLLMSKHDTYKDIAEDIERRFDTSKFEIDKLLPKAEKSNRVNERYISG